MLDESEYLRWLASAKRTLESAQGDLSRGDYNWACFKAQQAAEMAVKALLHGLGLPAYGHSVSRLLINLGSKGLQVSNDIINLAKSLDKYYIPTRYPNAWVEGTPYDYYTVEDAESAIRCAKSIIEWVEEVWRYLRRGER